MKALSIKQPWAWLIANGYKSIETRTWATEHRGELLIVSSLKPCKEAMEFLRSNIEVFRLLESVDFEYGKAIAIVNLAECRPMTKADQDAALCDIYPNAYSWVLDNVMKIRPFPVKGWLKLYDVDYNSVIRGTNE